MLQLLDTLDCQQITAIIHNSSIKMVHSGLDKQTPVMLILHSVNSLQHLLGIQFSIII